MADLTVPFLQPSRVIVEAVLRPVIGTRIQPTGFPNLGAAEYTLPRPSGATSETTMLLVESPQSIANRLEQVMWDDDAGRLVSVLDGLPYVRTTVDGEPTDSIREAHRLNSPFLKGIWEPLRERASIRAPQKKGKKNAPVSEDDEDTDSSGVDIRKLAAAVFYYDPNAVLHGVFLTNIVGLARLTRLLSGFIEAENVTLVSSGGVKNDRVDPSGKRFGGAKEGFGNVPYPRTEYAADTIRASFSLDNVLLHSYGLGADAERLLTLLALWKIRKFLGDGVRLRSACDLEVNGAINVKRPAGQALPDAGELEAQLSDAIAACTRAGIFAQPAVTDVAYAA